jgi:[ribosomal protein S5]-alanine N-acetyltransferase
VKPTLAGPRLTLRPVSVSDRAGMARLLRLPPVRRYLCDDRVLDDARVERLIDWSVELDPRGLGLWRAALPGLRFAGLMGLTPTPHETTRGTPVEDMIEPSVALHPELWGGGLAQEGLALLTAHARDGLRLRRLAAMADAPNARSRRMLARAGFREAGEAPGIWGGVVLWTMELR